MKEVVTGRCGGLDVLHGSHSFGIFIIDQNGQIVLQKKSIISANSTIHRWTLPRVPFNRFVQTPTGAAQQFLGYLKTPSQVHELFTPGLPHKPSKPQIGFVIIAVASNEAAEILCQCPGNYKVPFDALIDEINTQPDVYPTWFCKAIESVALYLKNVLKTSTLQHRIAQQKLS